MQGGGWELCREGRGKGKIDLMENETDKFTDNDNVPVVPHFIQREFYLTNFKPPIRYHKSNYIGG